ncbi:DUF488 family protein [Methanococcoides methylutens]|uniref:DUF488 domain-containing protein n=1 Tax=Methanococcoides methylutens MM1 TaxID=1434104 RepID=A0A0E3SSQ7_METMT|nr:DUF488 domain-containing protein [Methanococcoides methylutens]AKB85648.1 hypothetical protein MCMEM_1595 [Methanococcoides methylutens MM1]
MDEDNRCYTIGYGNRSLDEFIEILQQYGLSCLIDVRSYPHSVREEFNKENLEVVLPKYNITYSHCPGLGGLREESYTDYMRTDKFRGYFTKLIDKIIEVNSNSSGIVLMCAEKNPKGCHRYKLSNELESSGIRVIHLTDPGQADLFSF